MGGDASSASTSAIISRRLLDLDASLADQIDSGLMCHLTPIESMYGVLSRGSLGAYVATLKYVPGVAPAVATLMHAAAKLDFGPGRGQPVNYRLFYEPFLDALRDVDRFDLIFDVKAVVTLFANALSTHGTRGSARW
jgi:hypothetical protein